METNNDKFTFKRLLVLIVLGVILYTVSINYKEFFGMISKFFSIISPFILGACMAFVMIVPLRFVERHLAPNNRKFDKYRRGVSYIITLLFIFAIIALALVVVIPQVSSAISQIIAKIPSAFDSFDIWIQSLAEKYPMLADALDNVSLDGDMIQRNALKLVKNYGLTVVSSGTGIISSIAGSLTNGVIAFIFSIYLVTQKEQLAGQAKQILYGWFKEPFADRCVYVARLSNRIFSNFISGQCIEACILGMMFFVTLLIFRLPYAMLIGVVIAISALIPIFGAFIGLGIGTFLIIIIDPVKALYFIIIFFVIQQIENNLIYPRVVGGSIGLPSLWVLFAVTAGASLFGVAGILVFIPACSIMYALFREATKNRLKGRKIANAKYTALSSEDTDAIIDKIEAELYHKEIKEDKPKKNKKTNKK